MDDDGQMEGHSHPERAKGKDHRLGALVHGPGEGNIIELNSLSRSQDR